MLYEAREQEREVRRVRALLSPRRGPGSEPSLERFRTSGKYQDRPAAADIALCVAAYASGVAEAQIERALQDNYLPRSKSFKARLLRPEDHDEGERLDWALKTVLHLS
jgi:hypothetical protein